MKELGRFLWTFGLLLLVLLLFLLQRKRKRKLSGYLIVKSLLSLVYVALGCLALSRGTPYAPLLLMAFVASMMGDVALAQRSGENIDEDRSFKMGIAAFSVAQIFFILYYSRLYGVLSLFALIAAVILTVLILSGVVAFRFKVGRALFPIAVYTLLVCFSLTSAAVLAFEQGGLSAIGLCVGAGLFVLSDIVLLFYYFGNHRSRALGILNLALYYLAQCTIGLCALLQ